MLWSLKQLQGCKLRALDGDFGRVRECIFDDQDWVIRYLVATGPCRQGRAIFISTYAIGRTDAIARTLEVKLTRQKILHGPCVATDLPVSHEQADDYLRHHDWLASWNGPNQANAPSSRLRHTREVTGFALQAGHDTVGHVEDFLIDDITWAISSIVMSSKPAWRGKNVFIPPQSITRAVWNNPGSFTIQHADSCVPFSR